MGFDAVISFFSSRPESYILGAIASVSLLYIVFRIINKSSFEILEIVRNPVGFGLLLFSFSFLHLHLK